jgi:hypothetical protein
VKAYRGEQTCAGILVPEKNPCVSPSVGLDNLEKKKISCPLPGFELLRINFFLIIISIQQMHYTLSKIPPDYSSRSLVTISTELSRLFYAFKAHKQIIYLNCIIYSCFAV